MWGIDIRDVLDGDNGLSPARVLRLLMKLGDDSAYAEALNGGAEHRGWTYERYATTAELDLLQNILFVLLKANGASKAKPPEPLPTPADNQSKKAKGQNMFAAMASAAMDGQPITKWV